MSTAKAVVINPDWLDGVVAAANWADGNYNETDRDEIIDAVIAEKVRSEAGL